MTLFLNSFVCEWLLKLTFSGYERSLRHSDFIFSELEYVGVRFLRFSRKRQYEFASKFFQGLEENTKYVHYNLLWKTLHRAFNV